MQVEDMYEMWLEIRGILRNRVQIHLINKRGLMVDSPDTMPWTRGIVDSASTVPPSCALVGRHIKAAAKLGCLKHHNTGIHRTGHYRSSSAEQSSEPGIVPTPSSHALTSSIVGCETALHSGHFK